MPAPKYRQQTPLSPFSLIGAGFRGLNTELKTLAGLVDTTWALDLQNAVWGTSGLLETRKGYVNQTTRPMDGGSTTLTAAVVQVTADINGDNNVGDAVFGGTFTVTDIRYNHSTNSWVLEANGVVAQSVFHTVVIEYAAGLFVTFASADATFEASGDSSWTWSSALGWEDSQQGESRAFTFYATAPLSAGDVVHVVHEYVRADETASLIAVTNPSVVPDIQFWHSTDDGDSWSDITGSVSTTTVRWKFVNFQDEVYAAAPGHKVHRYTGSGNLTEIAASPVTNGTIAACFGRIWIGVDASDSSRITYSGLLDGTDWVSTSSGTIDASNAWTLGRDNIQGLAAFGAAFVVFGRRHILIYVDGAGSELGVDPDNMYVVDTIEGTGLADRCRDTLVNIGEGDLWFMGPKGIQSLARTVAEKTNPLTDVSSNVASLISDLQSEQVGAEGNVQAVYSAFNDFILFVFPESEIVVMFDTAAGPMEDGTYRAAEWRGLPFFSICVRQNHDVLFGLGNGTVARYEGYRDNSTTEYNLVIGSPWLDGGEQAHSRIKILKSAKVQLVGRETLTGTFRWGFDFRPLEYFHAFSSDYIASGDEYAIGEYGEAEYGEGHRSRAEYIPLGGTGQFVKFHLTVKSDDVDAKVALQEITAYAKLGRMT